MPDWFVVILLGVVEGITEFLPISSTGHLLLVEHGLSRVWGIKQQSDLFNVGIQSAAVLAVLLIFMERLKLLLSRWREPESQAYLGKLAVAFVVTGVGGLLLKKLGLRLPEDPAPVAWATLVGGVLFLAVEAWLRGRRPATEVTWTIAIAVGVGQLLAAVFPGFSRSGATILVGLALGLGRPEATEFSFLLSIPTLCSAGALEFIKGLRATGGPAENWAYFALGSVTAALTAFVAVRWLLRYVQSHSFVGFGWYRIVVGGLILLWVR